MDASKHTPVATSTRHRNHAAVHNTAVTPFSSCTVQSNPSQLTGPARRSSGGRKSRVNASLSPAVPNSALTGWWGAWGGHGGEGGGREEGRGACSENDIVHQRHTRRTRGGAWTLSSLARPPSALTWVVYAHACRWRR